MKTQSSDLHSKRFVFLCQLKSLRRSQRMWQKLFLLKVKALRFYQRFKNVSVWEESLQSLASMIEEFMLSAQRKQKMSNAFYCKISLSFQYSHPSLLDWVLRITRCLQIQTQCMLWLNYQSLKLIFRTTQYLLIQMQSMLWSRRCAIKLYQQIQI